MFDFPDDELDWGLDDPDDDMDHPLDDAYQDLLYSSPDEDEEDEVYLEGNPLSPIPLGVPYCEQEHDAPADEPATESEGGFISWLSAGAVYLFLHLFSDPDRSKKDQSRRPR